MLQKQNSNPALPRPHALITLYSLWERLNALVDAKALVNHRWIQASSFLTAWFHGSEMATNGNRPRGQVWDKGVNHTPRINILLPPSERMGVVAARIQELRGAFSFDLRQRMGLMPWLKSLAPGSSPSSRERSRA